MNFHANTGNHSPRRRLLPYGGRRERKIVHRLHSLAQHNWKWQTDVERALEKWRRILRVYYRRKPLSLKAREWKWYEDLKQSPPDLLDPEEVKWFAELMQGGMPEPISNFVMQLHYQVIKSDGTVERYVSLFKHREERSDVVALPWKVVTSRRRFRAWVWHRGLFCWFGRQRELDYLLADMAEANWINQSSAPSGGANAAVHETRRAERCLYQPG